jgi:hypothetical protein
VLYFDVDSHCVRSSRFNEKVCSHDRASIGTPNEWSAAPLWLRRSTCRAKLGAIQLPKRVTLSFSYGSKCLGTLLTLVSSGHLPPSCCLEPKSWRLPPRQSLFRVKSEPGASRQYPEHKNLLMTALPSGACLLREGAASRIIRGRRGAVWSTGCIAISSHRRASKKNINRPPFYSYHPILKDPHPPSTLRRWPSPFSPFCSPHHLFGRALMFDGTPKEAIPGSQCSV